MKTWLLSYLTNVPRLAGVELYLSDDGIASIRYAILKRSGNIVEFEKGEYHFQTLAELIAAIGSRLPIALTISGKGIMHRSLPTEEQSSDVDYAKRILPNTSIEEFFIQTTLIAPNTIISLVRKETVTNILDEFSNLGMEILTVTLGPFSLQPLWLQLKPIPSNTFKIDAHSFIVVNSLIIDYKINSPQTNCSQKIVFAGEELNECVVVAYATGLCLMADMKFPIIDLKSFNINKDEYHQRTLFKKLLIGTLSFLFFISLVNTFLFMHYSSQIDDHNLGNIESLKAEENTYRLSLKNEQELLYNITRPSGSQYGSLTRIADLLAVSQPFSIILNEMSIFPNDGKESRKAIKPVFNFQLVKLSGVCSDGQDLNHWLSDIRKLNFCQKVEIKEYLALEKGSAAFTLNLYLN